MLDAVGLQVILEPLEELGVHLERHRAGISLCHSLPLHFKEFFDQVGHVHAERLPGLLLPLTYLDVQGFGDLGAEILGFLCLCHSWHLLLPDLQGKYTERLRQ